jgi:hypothetical protein
MNTYPSENLLRGDWCAVLRTWNDRLFRVDDFFADLGLDLCLGRLGGFLFYLLFCLLVRFGHRRRLKLELNSERGRERERAIFGMGYERYVSEVPI